MNLPGTDCLGLALSSQARSKNVGWGAWDKKAALNFMKKAMRQYGTPNGIVTYRPPFYIAAAKELGCADKQVTQ